MRIGRYEVLSHLATGGMAQIYLARQTGLGSFERHVVLKTIARERATDQRFVTMFLDEAKLAATLNHQNVAQVYEVDQADGTYFMAMEYVHGENTRAILETTIRRGWTIPLELAIMIISGAAAGLHHAHERRGKNGQPLNIVHRDVSPANIMVGFDGSVKVLDFGIAKAEERATKTIGGTIKGKYGYMSPEQCKGKPLDRRSDIFALGIVLYELTTLRRAFKGNDDFETMKRIVAGDLVMPSTIVPGFPRELEAIILTALATDSGARFQSAQELIEALDAFTVRAKLTGSNTAMGRFMLQLFGTKKEPWIDAAVQSTDHTLVTPAELDDDDDEENNETQVIMSRHDAQRVVGDLNIARSSTAADTARLTGPVTPQPQPVRPSGAGTPQPQPVRPPGTGTSQSIPIRSPGASTSQAMPVRSPGPGTPQPQPQPVRPTGAFTPQPMPVRPTGASHAHPQPHSHSQRYAAVTPPPAEAEPAGPPPSESSNRLSARRSAERPSLPFAGQSMDRTPPPALSAPAPMAPMAPMPRPAPMAPMAPMAPQPSISPLAPGDTSDPALAITQIAPELPMYSPAPTASGLPALVQNEDMSELGAQPLVTDSRLGWNTSVQLFAPNDGGHTRLPSEGHDFRIRSNTKWILLAIVVVLGVAAGFAAMLMLE